MPNPTFTVDRYTRIVLTIATGLLAVIALELISLPAAAPAQAQIPNSGLQRNQQLDETRKTNELLRAILDRLTDGPVPVRLTGESPQRAKGGK